MSVLSSTCTLGRCWETSVQSLLPCTRDRILPAILRQASFPWSCRCGGQTLYALATENAFCRHLCPVTLPRAALPLSILRFSKVTFPATAVGQLTRCCPCFSRVLVCSSKCFFIFPNCPRQDVFIISKCTSAFDALTEGSLIAVSACLPSAASFFIAATDASLHTLMLAFAPV